MNSISKENYLTVIYRLRDSEGEIKPTVIAERLRVSNAAVTDMFKKLSRDKLIIYTPYRAAKFTEFGEKSAKALIRRHRIWEIFLHQVVRMPWDKVHDEAENLEHHSSNELINRMEEMLNFPEYDPHGDPIPKKNGEMPKQQVLVPLSSVKMSIESTVKRVSDYNSMFLSYIFTIGINLHTKIKIIEKREFDDSLLIEVNNNHYNISSTIADNIFVSVINNRA